MFNFCSFPTVSWYFGDRILRDSDRIALGATRGKRTLEIRSCSAADIGSYRCLAVSSKGEATSEFSIDVTSRRYPLTSSYERSTPPMKLGHQARGPAIVGQLHVELRLDGTVHVECAVSNSAEVQRVVWRKDAVPVR